MRRRLRRSWGLRGKEGTDIAAGQVAGGWVSSQQPPSQAGPPACQALHKPSDLHGKHLSMNMHVEAVLAAVGAAVERGGGLVC